MTASRDRSIPQRLQQQASRYLQSFVWLVRESLRVAPRQWRRIAAATFVSLGSNAAVVATVFIYVRLLERNPTLNVLGLEVIPRESTLILSGFVGMILLGMLIYAGSDYIARAAALRIHRLYQEEATRQTLHLARHLPDPRAPELAELLESGGLRRYYSVYPRSCSWTMRLIGNAFPALVMFLGAFAALLWLDPSSTLLVTLLGLGVVAAQYPANLFAATASSVLDKTRGIFGARLSALADAVDRTPSTREADALTDRIERLYDDPMILRYQDANEDRYRALELSALSMQTGGALVLAIILFIIAAGLISDSGDWAVLAVYATLLRLLLSNITGVFRAVTVFSRFSPHIHAYREFVTAAGRAAAKPDTALAVPDSLMLAASEIEGTATTVPLARGEDFVLVTRSPVGRGLALAFQRAATLGLREAREPNAGPIELPGICTVVVSKSADAADAQLREGLENALMEGADVLLVARSDFQTLSPDDRARWAFRLLDRRVGMVQSAPPSQTDPGRLILIQDGSGAFHWLRPADGKLARRLRKLLHKKLRANGSKRAAQDEEID
jgi:ABC-type multidrug transport system fused ATPase/permease subunit